MTELLNMVAEDFQLLGHVNIAVYKMDSLLLKLQNML